MKDTKTNWAIGRNLLGIIVLAAVIGFSACDSDNGSDGGQGVAPTITTSTLPNGAVGTAYSQTLAAAGDTPITWSLEAGALPTGLNLLGNGTISGTPTTVGEYTFFVRASNTAGSNIKQFSITITSGGGGNPNVDTSALNAVIQEAEIAKIGIVTASNASEVPRGKSWVTQSEWNTFDGIYNTAVETKENPASQSAADTAKTNLQTALVTFNAAKKNGSAAAITLSGTITIKNKGQLVPYVHIQAHNNDWTWLEEILVHLTGEKTPWSIITKPLPSPTDIVFTINGYNDDKYEDALFSTDVDGLTKTIHNKDVNNIIINSDFTFITISGTFNFDYNGQPFPSVDIQIIRKSDFFKLGSVNIYNAGSNTPWSTTIQSQAVNTDTIFYIVCFKGPKPWEDDILFERWGVDFGVKVGNQNKPGIALNLITISGTVSVTYKGKPVPTVEINIFNQDDHLGNAILHNPAANAPWSVVIPAFTRDTEILISPAGYEGYEVDGDKQLFWKNEVAKRTVKNTNVSGIVLNLGNITN